MTNEILGLIGTGFLIAGFFGNIRKRRWCFLMWMVSTALYFAAAAIEGLYVFCARDAIIFVLCFYGWKRW